MAFGTFEGGRAFGAAAAEDSRGPFCGARGNRFHRFATLLCSNIPNTFPNFPGPDMKAAVAEDSNIPCSPDSLSFTKSSIEDRMRPGIRLAPPALAILAVV